MAYTRRGTTINFQNNCLLCLEPESPSTLLEILRTNPNLLRTFQPVLHYLSGTDPTYTKSQLECKAKGLPVMANLPPLCVSCYNLTSSIYRLHAELLECQVNIQKITEQVRKVVSSTRKNTPPPFLLRRTKRNLFLHRLRSSGMPDKEVTGMRYFVQKLHDTIIEQGSNKVIFPSEPPPNFIPLPPRRPPEAQPLILLQLPTPPPVPQEVTPSSSPPPSPSPPSSPGPIITSVVSIATGVPPSIKKSPPSTTHTTYPPKSKTSDTFILPSGNQAALKFENEAEEELEDDQQNNEDDQDHHPLVQFEKEENYLDNLNEPEPPPPPVQDIIKQEPQDNHLPPKVINDDDDPSSDWEIDTQKDEDNTEDDTEEEIIPKKKRKANQSPSPPSSPPPPPSLPHPPKIFSPPLLQHQAAQILLHLSIPFHRPPPPPKKLPTIKIKPPENLPCEICNEYRPLNHIKPHLLAVHSGVQGHSCPICQKIFISTSRLVHHWETRKCGKDPLIPEQLEKFYTCLICSSTQSSPPEKRSNLTQMSTHIFSIHERDTSLPKCYVCGICKFKFRTKLGLDFHFNLHTHPCRRLKNYEKFRDICPLDLGWRKERKIKFFKKPNFNNLKVPCDQCQVNYICCHLEKHLIDHHGILKEDLEKCGICKYRSSKMESLRKHMKICHKKEVVNGTTTNGKPPDTLKEVKSVENGN